MSRTLALPSLFVFSLTLTSLWSWHSQGLVHDMLRPDWNAVQRVDRLKQFFDDCGVFAPIAYVAFVTVEVIVAPIPGIMLYAPGGLLFGPWLGGALATLGNTIGAGLSCWLARRMGNQWTSRFFASDSVTQAQLQLENKGMWLIFFLRVNPLTSTDLLSYAAGFTRISIWKVMLATGLGMAPLCFVQSWISDSVFDRFPSLIYPLIGLSIVYLAIVLAILRRYWLASNRVPDGDLPKPDAISENPPEI